jgi:hypothetical protein
MPLAACGSGSRFGPQTPVNRRKLLDDGRATFKPKDGALQALCVYFPPPRLLAMQTIVGSGRRPLAGGKNRKPHIAVI